VHFEVTTSGAFSSDRRQLREVPAVGIRLSEMRLMRPRQWGACWLGCQLWDQLGLDGFWKERLPVGREGARWADILKIIAIYRLVSPGSEWRLHRHWFQNSAMADLLGGDASLAEIHHLYECHDKLLEHKTALFNHLTERWKTLFDAKFDVLLYDLTSTYFESNPPFPEGDKRRYGYSRDKRSDCVQVAIALIVTPDGFPIAYEVRPGNTSDKTTLRDFLQKIETQYGKANRIWVMDPGLMPSPPGFATLRAAVGSKPLTGEPDAGIEAQRRKTASGSPEGVSGANQIRQSGSEGGAGQPNAPFLPLFWLHQAQMLPKAPDPALRRCGKRSNLGAS